MLQTHRINDTLKGQLYECEQNRFIIGRLEVFRVLIGGYRVFRGGYRVFIGSLEVVTECLLMV